MARQGTLRGVLVDAWLPRAAAARPERAAVNALTYAGLRDAPAAAARVLLARGARPGARVGLALAPGEAYAVALHACLWLGAVAVPLDLRLAAAERERRASGCVTIVDEALHEGDRDRADVELPATHDLGA